MTLDLLRTAVERHTGSQFDPSTTAVPGLILLRSDRRNQTNHHISKPALCVVVQGAKWTMYGEKRFDYHAGQALVVSVELPAFSTIVEASSSKPYMGVIIEFDLAVMREVVNSLDISQKRGKNTNQSVFVKDFDGPLLDCAVRMVRLLDTPHAIAHLYPLIMREICYWLLTGPHGGEVLSMTVSKGHTSSILSAIHFLRDHYTESIGIEQLASIARMSPSTFQRQFKEITSMTPLQYQKQLRLLQARRIMVADEKTVKTAAFEVGYESPTQFSREYARMFGVPPRRDMINLRE